MGDYVNWDAVWKIALVAALGGVGVVSAFGIYVRGWAAARESAAEGRSAIVGYAEAGVGLAICVAAAIVGLWAMMQK